ncbi:tetratricopeptide repeat protein [Maridesulfovibrio frigidus]|uniref:tetratricopeptide repeat protein n=1 Tax=Maridesulfovibrio frigidus TaxID=340956 RepID=UPI0004E27E17|nr:tetratricopeptide repeat protein [Maridesulfovibrio frigidus]
MQSKIEWYQEVLALEPSSKVFFPLARLYVEIGNLEKAVTALRMGLDRHPDYLESRLLLVETLTKLGRDSEAKAAVAPLTRLFSSYPSFWKMWGDSVSEGNDDVAGAMAFLFSALHGNPLSWSDVMSEGIKELTGISPVSKDQSLSEVSSDESSEDPDSGELSDSDILSREIEHAAAQIDIDGEKVDGSLTSSVAMDSLRTRTMADVLASQGELVAALDIYRELLSRAEETQKDELLIVMSDISAKISNGQSNCVGDECSEADDPYIKNAKNKLMNTLEILAERLEARAAR